MTTPVAGPGTPYISRVTLFNASTGIAWSTIPYVESTEEEQNAEQVNICWRATAEADGICGQVLRATISTEQAPGPGSSRLNIQQDTGQGIFTTRRWPVLDVTAVSIAGNRLPYQWKPVPPGLYAPYGPPASVYGTTAPSDAGEGSSQVMIGSGYIQPGRMQQVARVTYANGWPHAGTTGSSAPGAATLAVDDVTGWAPPSGGSQGATGMIMDGAKQEVVSCTSVAGDVTSGPGTLNLASALTYPHEAGVVVSTLPPSAELAVILLCVAQALERGATATTHMQVPGRSVKGVSSMADARKIACKLLQPFARRV